MQTFFKLYMYGIKNFLNLEEKRFKFPLPAQRSCGKSLDPGKSGCPCQDEVSNFLSTVADSQQAKMDKNKKALFIFIIRVVTCKLHLCIECNF